MPSKTWTTAQVKREVMELSTKLATALPWPMWADAPKISIAPPLKEIENKLEICIKSYLFDLFCITFDSFDRFYMFVAEGIARTIQEVIWMKQKKQ